MKATRRHLWRRAASLAGGVVVGFLCISALRQPPYDQPRARRLQESDREKAIRLEQQGSGRADGTGVRLEAQGTRRGEILRRSLLVVCLSLGKV